MRKRLWGHIVAVAGVMVIVALIVAAPTFAESSSSTHYQIIDGGFGSGSTSQTCSSSYCSQTGLGSLTSGFTGNDSNTANIGQSTDSEPVLDVSVEGGSSDLGDLNTESTATKTMTVKIRNYLSSGYILQISGTPPHIKGHTITALASPTASAAGTEQFGLNAVANSSPNVGADPLQIPSTQTSFGAPVAGYDTANLFKYVDGDVVARSPKSSGETDFTISMIINISNVTPAGHYSGDFSAVVVPVY
jgi:hypothetical protein